MTTPPIKGNNPKTGFLGYEVESMIADRKNIVISNFYKNVYTARNKGTILTSSKPTPQSL